MRAARFTSRSCMLFCRSSAANMNPLPINWLLSLTLVFVVSEAGLLLHKTDVLIYNDLDGGTDLTLHCKSKNNDLGIQHLAYRNYFEFNFRPSFLGNTLFYCSMQWNGTMRWFDIYLEGRDVSRCIRCLWYVRPDGPCLSNYEICYHWKSVD
ncbi:hypothetical protein Gohar_024821 [Gossypium harknessii]|uniref:S-protein homolog n=1 Tax=Gossypium harknessii TaxID=34285 RepID=A0A7J9HH41_9ROSI|nr:hypothetical protein [Gossypium harknessii]